MSMCWMIMESYTKETLMWSRTECGSTVRYIHTLIQLPRHTQIHTHKHDRGSLCVFQFERGVLEACIYILDACNMPIDNRGNSIYVTRQASAMVSQHWNIIHGTFSFNLFNILPLYYCYFVYVDMTLRCFIRCHSVNALVLGICCTTHLIKCDKSFSFHKTLHAD